MVWLQFCKHEINQFDLGYVFDTLAHVFVANCSTRGSHFDWLPTAIVGKVEVHEGNAIRPPLWFTLAYHEAVRTDERILSMGGSCFWQFLDLEVARVH